MSNKTKQNIQQSIQQFTQGNLRQNSLHLLATLGYESDRQIEIENTPTAFLDTFDQLDSFRQEKALFAEWQSVDVLCQITDDKIRQSNQLILMDSASKVVDKSIIESYLFVAIGLSGEQYTRTQLAHITREVNKLFSMPVMLIFQHGQTLTLSIINRRLHKRDGRKDVLEKVTLIKDIRIGNPHRAHLEILFDLSLEQLHKAHQFGNFVELHKAWGKTLDSSELNKKFFKEIADWYFWAVDEVTFPKDAGPDETRNATSIIRLITRLIFVWFLKEKGVVPDDLFNKRKLDELLLWEDYNDSTYYKAILQNLFFATLNQEMNTAKKPDNRKFRGRRESGQDQHFMIHNVYRYAPYFKDEAVALALFANIPFLNGGLFECLDKSVGKKRIRIDGFSDRDDNSLRVPDNLFFSEEHDVDLNATYGTKGKGYKVRGLIDILNRYKFTITENTPIEEEIALDPELLGKVFENLLAAYNPETGTTARKQTGSFYTPREIVDYMVDESLLAYLEAKLKEQTSFGELPDLDNRLRHLFAYNEEEARFDDAEKAALIEAIDAVDILDPACGSGAFPMGILHKLVFILGKLDPHNAQWKERQIAPLRAAIEATKAIPDSKIRNQTARELEEQITAVEAAFTRNELDYGRKLYLIENCIYGVDIQPVAVQIAKLRFFISLVVDQRIEDGAVNRGVLPLPNLETKFVGANTLLGIEKPKTGQWNTIALRNPEIKTKEKELADVRSKHFRARTPKTKAKYREQDKQLRGEIGKLLQKEGMLLNEDVQRLAGWNPYNQNATAEFFDLEWMFGLTDGFDVVIGNPPYVRQEKIKELKPALKRQYSCYTGVADLYVYFIEGGFNLLKEGGELCYICSNKYFRAGYGKKLRGFLSKQATVQQLIDFGDAPVFTAIAYPSIVLLQKKRPNVNQLMAFNWEPGPPVTEFKEIFEDQHFTMPQTALTADGWRLEKPEVLALLAKLRGAGKPLGEYVEGRFYRGILTGLNKAFVVDRATRDCLIAEHPSSAEILKPFLRGRDVKRWQAQFAEQYLIRIESSANKKHPWSGKPDEVAEKVFAETYPAIHAYFQPLRKRLIKRSDQGQYFWELRSCAYWNEFDTIKIIYPNICKTNEFAWDEDSFLTNQKAFIISRSSKYLLAILNSQVVTWLFDKLLAKLQNGYYEPSMIFMKDFPIVVSNDVQPLELRVNQILASKRSDSMADVSSIEREINELVYALYSLTPLEIELIEGRELSKVTPTIQFIAPPLIFTGQPPQGIFSQRLKRVQALGKQSSPAVIQELVAALADDADSIRWAAGLSLKGMDKAQVAGVLHAFIEQTENATAKAEAEKLLQSFS